MQILCSRTVPRMAVKHNAPQVVKQINAIKVRMRRESPVLVNRTAESVKADIATKIESGTKIDGGRRSRLRLSTVKAKQRRRTRDGKALPASKSPSTPLLDTGAMKNVLITKTATRSKPTAIIRPAASREDVKGFDVAAHHQDDKYGKWFGIARDQAKKMERLGVEMLKRITVEFNRGS